MLRPMILNLIRLASLGTILFGLYIFDKRISGREIDLESGRTRTFLKYPGVPERYGPTRDNAFSNFVRNRLGINPAAPQWRKTRSSGGGTILSGPTHCWNHSLTERDIQVFMSLIERAPIDDVCRKKLVSEMFARLRSDDPMSVHDFFEKCLNKLIDVEGANISNKKTDCIDW
jgi:hypothetical protein